MKQILYDSFVEQIVVHIYIDIQKRLLCAITPKQIVAHSYT